MPKHKVEHKTKESLKSYWQSLSKSQFTGYIMMSDSPMEYAFASPSELPSWETLHAQNNFNFIWEANLYEENKRSISIQQCNDKWQIGEVLWNETSDSQEIKFMKQECIIRFPQGERQIEKTCIMQEAWIAVQDEFCENMEVLKPAWTAFMGFKKEGA